MFTARYGLDLYIYIYIYIIDWFVFIIETECVYCAVRTGFLIRIHVILSFQNISFWFQILKHKLQPTKFTISVPTSQGTHLLKFSAANFPETVVNFYQTTRCEIPKKKTNLKIHPSKPKLIHRYSREVFFSDSVRNCRTQIAVYCNFAIERNKITCKSVAIFGPDKKSFDWWAASTRVGTLIVATIYLQLIQNRYMFRSFTVLQCSHQHCV